MRKSATAFIFYLYRYFKKNNFTFLSPNCNTFRKNYNIENGGKEFFKILVEYNNKLVVNDNRSKVKYLFPKLIIILRFYLKFVNM